MARGARPRGRVIASKAYWASRGREVASARTAQHVASAVAAVELQLFVEQRRRITEAGELGLGSPAYLYS